MDDLDRATTLGDFVQEIASERHDFEPKERDYKLVYWDGKERVPLTVASIDHATKCIVFGRIYGGDIEEAEPVDLRNELPEDGGIEDVPNFHQSARAQYAEQQRRYGVDDAFGAIADPTLEDAEAYMADVLARGPLSNDYTPTREKLVGN